MDPPLRMQDKRHDTHPKKESWVYKVDLFFEYQKEYLIIPLIKQVFWLGHYAHPSTLTWQPALSSQSSWSIDSKVSQEVSTSHSKSLASDKDYRLQTQHYRWNFKNTIS